MKNIIQSVFHKPKKTKLYTILVTEEILQFFEDNKPSGGWYGEYCRNSDLFRNRKCKIDNKYYKKGYRCGCFV